MLKKPSLEASKNGSPAPQKFFCDKICTKIYLSNFYLGHRVISEKYLNDWNKMGPKHDEICKT